MDHEFTVEEIREAARVARIYCPGFSDEKFESLMELESRADEPGYLEAVQGLLRLEEEKGVLCTEALDAYEGLLESSTKLGKQVAGLELKLQSLKDQIRHSKEEYGRIKEATGKAERELAGVRGKHGEEEKELNAFKKKAEAEKQRIDKEIEDYHQRANVTREDVATAGQIKAEVESHGFALELVLGLSQEFTGHENAREKLAEGLKKHGALTRYLKELAEWGEGQRAALKSELASLESQRRNLDESRSYLETLLSQLQADVTAEEELRRFYRRYQGVSGLMEHLAGWNQVFFIRCNNPLLALTGAFDRNSGNAHFWTDKPPVMCPHCGYRQLLFDERLYEALNWPVGVPLKLRLGE